MNISQLRETVTELLSASPNLIGTYTLPNNSTLPAVYVVGRQSVPKEWKVKGLEVTIEEYTEVIDKCSYWEGLFIISVFLGNHIDKFERAREVFDSHRIKEYADS